MRIDLGQRDNRRDPRFLIDLPLEYLEPDHLHVRGGILINASENGFLMESVKDISINTRLNIAVLFPKWFELAEFKLVAEIIWKEPLWKEDWTGYRYGLNVVEMTEEDRKKLKLILRGHFNLGVFPFGPWQSEEAINSRRSL